jgi:hypothetical protein
VYLKEILLRNDLPKNKGSLTINETRMVVTVTHGENREPANRETLRSTVRLSLWHRRTAERITGAKTGRYLVSITDTTTASKAGAK